ncbi:sigma factor-like helix-turn-helix DNA-binding protein [Paenibacillus sp. 8b26]|uniref:sigma factor-like helix-turn-helix DNA-binding protein n=1 Tax=Paenibacillus sp. 8b26 TaxID=3424133 RepID=UPI003D64BC26
MIYKEHLATYELNFILDVYSSQNLVVEYTSLSQAVADLSIIEKKVLFLKFYKDKTDREIAETLGVSRQAISKLRKTILVKLKYYMEL